MQARFAKREYKKAGEDARLIATFRQYPDETKLVIIDGDKESGFEQYLKDHEIKYVKLNSPALYEENSTFIIFDRDFQKLISDTEHIHQTGKDHEAAETREDQEKSEKDERDHTEDEEKSSTANEKESDHTDSVQSDDSEGHADSSDEEKDAEKTEDKEKSSDDYEKNPDDAENEQEENGESVENNGQNTSDHQEQDSEETRNEDKDHTEEIKSDYTEDDEESDDEQEEKDRNESRNEMQDESVVRTDDTDHTREKEQEGPDERDRSEDDSEYEGQESTDQEFQQVDENVNEKETNTADVDRENDSETAEETSYAEEDEPKLSDEENVRDIQQSYENEDNAEVSSINTEAQVQEPDRSSESEEFNKNASDQDVEQFVQHSQEENNLQNNDDASFTQTEDAAVDNVPEFGNNRFAAPEYSQNANADQNSEDFVSMDNAAESKFQTSYDNENQTSHDTSRGSQEQPASNYNEQIQSDYSAHTGNVQTEPVNGFSNENQENPYATDENSNETQKIAEFSGAAAITIPLSEIQQPSSDNANSHFDPRTQQYDNDSHSENAFENRAVEAQKHSEETKDADHTFASHEGLPSSEYEGVNNYDSSQQNDRGNSGKPENQYEGINHFVDTGTPTDPYEGIGRVRLSDYDDQSAFNTPRDYSISTYDVGRVSAANQHDAIGEAIRKATLDPSDELRETQAAKGHQGFSTSIAPITSFLNPKFAATAGSSAIEKVGEAFSSAEDRQVLGIMVGAQFANDHKLSSEQTAEVIKSFQNGLTNGFRSFKEQNDFLKTYNNILSTDGFIIQRGAGGLSASGNVKDAQVINKGSIMNNLREKKKADLAGRGKNWTITAKERQTKNLEVRLSNLNKAGRLSAFDLKRTEDLRKKMRDTSSTMASYGDISRHAAMAKARGIMRLSLTNAQLQKALKSDATGDQLLKTRSNIVMTNMAVKGFSNLAANRLSSNTERLNAKMLKKDMTAQQAARMQKKINKLEKREHVYKTVGQWDTILAKKVEDKTKALKGKIKSSTKNGLKKSVNALEKHGYKKTAGLARSLNEKRRKIVAKFVEKFGPQSSFMKVIGAPQILANKVIQKIKLKVIKVLLPFLIKLILFYFIGLFGTCAVAACASVVMGFFEGFEDNIHSMMTTDIDNEEVEKSTLGIVYKELLSNEIDWVENLKTNYYDPKRPPTLDDMKYLTNFTETGEIDWDNHLVDIETYAANVLHTEYRDGKLKGPEPFDLAPDETYGWLYKFDGGAEVQFASAGGGYRYASNITEVMALAASASEQSDLTYQDYPDENKEDFDDANAAVKLWNAITDLFTKVRTALKKAVTSVFNVATSLIWGEDGKNEFWTRYKTQQNTLVEMAYCKPLFDQSHQEEYSVKMSLLPTKRTKGSVVASWNETTISASSTLTEQEIESKYNVFDTSAVNTNTISFTDQELNLATKIIEREVSDNKNNASSSDAQKTKYYKGWVACAEVIRNRVLSGSYPNSLSGVLSAKNQFSTYKSAASSTTVNQTVKEIVRRVFNGSEPSVFGRSDVTGWCASGTGNLNHPGEHKVGSVLGNDYYAPTEQAAKQYVIETETAESLNLVSVDMCPDEEHEGYGEKSWDKFYYLDKEDTLYHNVGGTLIEATPVEPAGLHDMPEDICVVPDGDPEKWIERSNNNMDCWSEGTIVDHVDDEVGGEGEYSGSKKITIDNRGYSYIGTNDGGKTVQVTVVTDVWPVESGSHMESSYDSTTGETIETEVPDYTDHRSTVTYSFTHDCIGDHTGYYCAGHLRLIITGVIYHITEAEKAGTEELMEDKSSKYKISILSNVEGQISYLGVGGALAIRVAERVEEKMGIDEQQMRDAKDIFDVDTAIVHKAGTVGPTFEGWTLATQETAAAKVSEAGEWKREYGIDVQGTIGGYDESYFASSYKLSQEEIDNLIASAGEISGTISFGDFGANQGDITAVAQAVAQAFLKANASHPYSVSKSITVKTSWGSYKIYPCCAGGTTLVAKYFGLKGAPTSATVNVANSSYIGNKVSVSKMSDFRVGDVITYGGAHTEIVTKIDGDKVYIAGFGSDTNIVKDASNGWNKAISKTLTVSQARNALGHSNTSMNVWRASESTYNVPSGN